MAATTRTCAKNMVDIMRTKLHNMFTNNRTATTRSSDKIKVTHAVSSRPHLRFEGRSAWFPSRERAEQGGLAPETGTAFSLANLRVVCVLRGKTACVYPRQGGAGWTILSMSWRKHMPLLKFDWSKERPAWKLAAWVVAYTTPILYALSDFIQSLK